MGSHAQVDPQPLLRRSHQGNTFRKALPVIIGVSLGLVVMAPVLYDQYLLALDYTMEAEYTVAIAGVSGLDPAHDLDRGTLDPAFNFTIRIKEPRTHSVEHVERGTVAAVSYRRVVLARGPVPEFRSESHKITEVTSVMAWGDAVPVPRFARESLANDLRAGAAVVDVTLISPHNCHHCKLIECKVAVAGGDASPPCHHI